MSVDSPSSDVADLAPITTLLHDLSAARNVPFELLCSALEESLAVAYQTHTGSTSAVTRFDPQTGGMEIYERRVVVAEVADSLLEIAIASVPGFELGDYVDTRVEPGSFARIAALSAKRIIFQRVLELERERVYEQYRQLEGKLVTGLVQRDVHGALYVLLDDRNEAAIPPWERSPRDRHRINDRVLCEVQAVRKTPRGPAIFLSRASERFVRLLIDDRAVVRAARTPGKLTLLLVTRSVDVAAARLEISMERIEQIPFHEDPVDVMRQGLPRGVQLLEVPFFDGVIAVSEDPRVHDRANILGRLAGRSMIATRPENLSELLGDLENEAATLEATATSTPEADEIDPELIRKLQEYARERGDIDADEGSE